MVKKVITNGLEKYSSYRKLKFYTSELESFIDKYIFEVPEMNIFKSERARRLRKRDFYVIRKYL